MRPQCCMVLHAVASLPLRAIRRQFYHFISWLANARKSKRSKWGEPPQQEPWLVFQKSTVIALQTWATRNTDSSVLSLQRNPNTSLLPSSTATANISQPKREQRANSWATPRLLHHLPADPEVWTGINTVMKGNLIGTLEWSHHVTSFHWISVDAG